MHNSTSPSVHNSFEKLHISVDRDQENNKPQSRSCLFGCGSKDADLYVVKSTLDSHCWDVRKRLSDFESLEAKMLARLNSQIGMSPGQADLTNTSCLNKEQARKIMDQMPELPPKKGGFWSSGKDADYYRSTSAGLQKYISDTIGISLRGNDRQFFQEISDFLGIVPALRKKAVLAPRESALVIEKEAYKERSEELEREQAMEMVKEENNKKQLFQQLSELQFEIEDAKSCISSAIADQPGLEASGAADGSASEGAVAADDSVAVAADDSVAVAADDSVAVTADDSAAIARSL